MGKTLGDDEHKLVVVYGKKPRKSKTSKIVEVLGHSFFLHQSKAGTRNNIDLYLFEEPYPLILCFYMGKGDTQLKVTDWIERNIVQIKAMIKDMDKYIKIPLEVYKKGFK